MIERNQYYVLKEKAVPEVLLKVIEAKRLLESGKVTSVQEATELVGISRSSFYKYKDDIFPYHETEKGKTVTMVMQLDDKPGILSLVSRVLAENPKASDTAYPVRLSPKSTPSIIKATSRAQGDDPLAHRIDKGQHVRIHLFAVKLIQHLVSAALVQLKGKIADLPFLKPLVNGGDASAEAAHGIVASAHYEYGQIKGYGIKPRILVHLTEHREHISVCANGKGKSAGGVGKVSFPYRRIAGKPTQFTFRKKSLTVI